MLTMTRRLTETLVIGGGVTLTLLDIKDSRVRIGVNVPREVIVKREALFQKEKRALRMPDGGP